MRHRILASLAAGFCAVALHAAQPTISASLINTLAPAKDITGKSIGFNVEFGLAGKIADTDYGYRAYLGFTQLSGKTGDWPVRKELGGWPNAFETTYHSDVKRDLSAITLGGEVRLPLVERLSWTLGMTINKYRSSNTWLTLERDTASMEKQSKGVTEDLKLGYSVGLIYGLSEQLEAFARFEQSELGYSVGLAYDDSLQRDRKLNPAWIKVGMTYRF